jgi:hypothetical protein
MKLHDLCLDQNVDIPTRHFVKTHGDFREADAALRGFSRGERRKLITNRLEELRVTRPVHTQMNSRCN